MDLTGANLGGTELKEGKRPIPPPSEISVKAGSVIFREGDNSRDVYIVKQGEVTVSQRRGNIQVDLAKLGERSVFGEMSLLDSQPRSATIRASEDSILTVIAPVTFMGMLKLIPPWLQAVIKVVSNRLRDTNKKIDLNTVPDPLESLCVFLIRKCREFRSKNQSTPVFPGFSIYDEYCLASRLKREEVQKQMQVLLSRRLVSQSPQQDIIVSDPDLLEILLEYLRCTRSREPFPYTGMDPLIVSTLDKLPQAGAESLGSKEALLQWLQESEPRMAHSHMTKLIEIGAIAITSDMAISVNKARILWISKANQQVDLISGKKGG